MIVAGAPSTENVTVLSVRDVPAPPGVVMLAPSEVTRNAEVAQCEDRARQGSKARPRGIIEAGAFGLRPL